MIVRIIQDGNTFYDPTDGSILFISQTRVEKNDIELATKARQEFLAWVKDEFSKEATFRFVI